MLRKSVVAILAASFLAVGAYLPQSARADSSPPAAPTTGLPATFSADALPTWQTNGTVWALESIGNVVYVGGTFTSVRPPGAAEGTGEVARNNFAAFNATTGDLLPCNPSFTHTTTAPKVFALSASPAGDRLYVGGAFNRVGSTAVSNLAAIDPSSCTILPTTTFRRPAVLATVRALDSTSTNVYAGGDFNTVDNQARTKYAAFDSKGNLLAGSLSLAGGKVNAILAAPDFGKVFLGGDFTGENGNSNRGLVAVDPATSAIVKTYPGWIPTGSAVKAFARDADSFYVGDEGTGFGVFDGRIAGDLATDTMRWKDYCLGATQALAVYQGVLYAGHHAHECQVTPGGWLEDGIRNHFTAQDVRDRTIIPTFFPDTNEGIGPAPLGPRALVVAGAELWAGGEFTTVNTAAQRGLTRFGMADTGTVFAPALTVTSYKANQNVISWVAGFDRDDDSLTYQLYRNGVLVHTATAQSREWSRTTMSYADNDVTGGQTYTYKIRVVEPDGQNTGAFGANASVTTASTDQGYPGAVLEDNPSLYWRLDETAEQNAATRTAVAYLRARIWDSSGNGQEGTAERGWTTTTGGYTLGGPSALDNGDGHSVTFDGAQGRIAESFTNDFAPAQTAPSTYSVELWFRTAGTTGGRLIGFGNRRTELYERTPPGDQPPVYINSLSSVTDRVVYLSDAGKLEFGNQAGSTKVVIKGAKSYNDGAWHHLVATSGAAGMNLFVDGIPVAANPNTQNASYAGYWKVGYDSLTGWAEKPANTALKGGIDEVAVYPTQLSRAQVVAHYLAGRPSAVIDLNPPTAPANVAVTRSSQNATVTWDASTDNIGVAGYQVYRTADPGDALSAANQVGSTASALSFTETNVPEGTWYYRIVAVDAAGNPSDPSDAASVTMPPPPVTLSVVSSADTYVHSSLKTSNFGTSTLFSVDSSPQQIGLLRFVLPAAPAGTHLVSATLRLRTSANSFSGSTDPQPVQLASDSWTETGVTWNSRPSLIAGTLGSLVAGTVPSTTYDIALDATALASSVGTSTTLALPGGGAGDGSEFQSREATNNRPTLILGFAP